MEQDKHELSLDRQQLKGAGDSDRRRGKYMWEAGGATRPLQGVISTDRMATRSPKGTLPASTQMSSQNNHSFSFFSLYWIITNTPRFFEYAAVIWRKMDSRYI